MSDSRLHLVLGSPGCGKTTRLLEIVEAELDAGVSASRIAFVTFTKAAADEGRERAARKFGLDPDNDLPHFRTIHSLAYGALGITREEVIGPKDWKNFSQIVGHPISGYYDADTPVVSGKSGDIMLRIVDFASTSMISLEQAWHDLNEQVDWFQLKRFEAAFRGYKADVSKMDFTDMLVIYVQMGNPLDVDVAVIDEAQDLTPAQWAVVYKAFGKAQRIYVGGDDDQAIYRWAGADVEHFLGLSTTPEVLGVSHRLPRTIFNLSQQVAGRITHRYRKPTRSADREGEIHYHTIPDSLDLSAAGSWLLLARNTYLLAQYVEAVRGMGYNYETKEGPAIDVRDIEVMKLWERIRSGKVEDVGADELRMLCKYTNRPVPALKDLSRYSPADYPLPLHVPWYDALEGIDSDVRNYYLSCLRRGTNLSAPPRIKIKTIHGVKGAEADNVAIMTDMSSKTARGFDIEPDHEHRVFYVGLTRARHNLHIIQPQSDRYYPI